MPVSGRPAPAPLPTAAGLANDAHGFDKVGNPPLIIANRRRLDIDMLLAARGVMQVQHALLGAGIKALAQRAEFTALIAGTSK